MIYLFCQIEIVILLTHRRILCLTCRKRVELVLRTDFRGNPSICKRTFAIRSLCTGCVDISFSNAEGSLRLYFLQCFKKTDAALWRNTDIVDILHTIKI